MHRVVSKSNSVTASAVEEGLVLPETTPKMAGWVERYCKSAPLAGLEVRNERVLYPLDRIDAAWPSDCNILYHSVLHIHPNIEVVGETRTAGTALALALPYTPCHLVDKPSSTSVVYICSRKCSMSSRDTERSYVSRSPLE